MISINPGVVTYYGNFVPVCSLHRIKACEQALWGTLAVGQKKEGELAAMSLEFEFHLQFPCGSLAID